VDIVKRTTLHGMFLIKRGACAVVEDVALHLERKFGHVPKSIANAFVDVWKQTLVSSASSSAPT